eukprot:5832684-Alexandrium_andersonii.AAC.1
MTDADRCLLITLRCGLVAAAPPSTACMERPLRRTCLITVSHQRFLHANRYRPHRHWARLGKMSRRY